MKYYLFYNYFIMKYSRYLFLWVFSFIMWCGSTFEVIERPEETIIQYSFALISVVLVSLAFYLLSDTK